MLRWIILASSLVGALVLAGCGDDSDGNAGGASASAGVGGMGGMPDAGVSCVDAESGCDDGNECTTDGMCESVTGMCIGAGEEPANIPCGQNGIFVCDGLGQCVGCNLDEQCDDFFPDEECRENPTCVSGACPLPDPRPDGTPCSGGECRSGVCSGPWAPKRQLVPMACGTSLSVQVFGSTMDLTVAPTPIAPAEQFSAFLDASIVIPHEVLQEAVIASFPAPLTSIEVSGARAEIRSTRVASGTPVRTTLAPLPQTVPIPQTANPGDPGAGPCATNEECPLAAFGQTCSFMGGGRQCDCACRSGCTPADCANLVIGSVTLNLEPIQGAIYGAFPSGDVCFDVGGDASDPDIAGAIRTGIRVSSGPVALAVECEGGVVNDNGTPDVPGDDFVDPNPPEDQICFPIGSPAPPSN